MKEGGSILVDELILYVKILMAAIIGWKLGRLERIVEDLINASYDRR